MATVYIIRAVGTRMIKVGITNDVDRRLSEIQSMCPVRLDVEDLLHGVDQTVERTIHFLMCQHRSHGEWFHEMALPIALRWFGITRQSAHNVADFICANCDVIDLSTFRRKLGDAGAENIGLAIDEISLGHRQVRGAVEPDDGMKISAARDAAERLYKLFPPTEWDWLKSSLFAAGAEALAEAFVNKTGAAMMDRANGRWS